MDRPKSPTRRASRLRLVRGLVILGLLIGQIVIVLLYVASLVGGYHGLSQLTLSILHPLPIIALGFFLAISIPIYRIEKPQLLGTD